MDLDYFFFFEPQGEEEGGLVYWTCELTLQPILWEVEVLFKLEHIPLVSSQIQTVMPQSFLKH